MKWHSNKKRFSKFITGACLTITMAISSLGSCGGIPSVFAATSFSDVKPDTWCYPYVMEMANKGLLTGYPDGQFKQARTITRAEMSALLARLKLPALMTYKNFPDISTQHWALSGIGASSVSGVTQPLTTNSLFQPEKPVTRNEIAIIASRLYGLQPTYDAANLAEFLDAHMISDQISQNAWKNVISAGIVGGYPDGTLKPNNPITRGEFCKIFNFVNQTTTEQLATNLRTSLINDNIIHSGKSDATTHGNSIYYLFINKYRFLWIITLPKIYI